MKAIFKQNYFAIRLLNRGKNMQQVVSNEYLKLINVKYILTLKSFNPHFHFINMMHPKIRVCCFVGLNRIATVLQI